MNNELIERLSIYKSRMERDKALRSEKLGALKELTKALKVDYDCANIKEARIKLRRLQAKLKNLESEFEDGLSKLEAEYERRASSSSGE